MEDKIIFNGADLVARIKLVLYRSGRTQNDLVAYIGRSRQILLDWKNNKTVPKSDDLYNMAKWLGVSMEWLLTGKDRMPDDVTIAAAILMSLADEDRKEMIDKIQSKVIIAKNSNE